MLELLATSNSQRSQLEPSDKGSRGPGEPLDEFGIACTHQLRAIGLTSRAREALAESRKASYPGSRAAALCCHATEMLVPQVARRPRRTVASSRRERGKDVKLSCAGDLRRRVGREVEVEGASLACRLSGNVEGEEGSDVGRSAVLEDLAAGCAVANCAGPDLVLRSDCGLDDVGVGWCRRCDVARLAVGNKGTGRLGRLRSGRGAGAACTGGSRRGDDSIAS